MPRRLISTDLDGTIVFNGTISLRDREAMARWRAAGNLLVINTGRSVSALEHVVVPMGLEFDNAILYTGAAIVDEDIRVRYATALPAGVVEDILDFVEGAPGVTVFTTGLDEDLLIYDTIGSGSELLTLFRPATRRELDGRGLPREGGKPRIPRMPRKVKEDIDRIVIDGMCDASHVLLIRSHIPPLRHERAEEVRVLILLAEIVDIDLECVPIKSRKERPDKILHDMLTKIARDIADADLLLFFTSAMGELLHIGKERPIPTAPPIDLRRETGKKR